MKNHRVSGKEKTKATSYTVAQEAGVSQSAVSRAYKPGGSVSKATREKIYAAAKKLGYSPNAIARSLISKRSNMIGIVMADITNPFYASVLEVFLQELQKVGLKAIVLVATRYQEVDDLLPQLLEYQVDGLIITSATLSSEMGRSLSDMGVPVVMFNRSMPDSHATSICCDNVAAGRQVAELFLSKGFKRFGYIAGVENTSTNRGREEGYYAKLNESGVQDIAREVGLYTYDGGYQAAVRIAKNGNCPEAIFCANDIMAMGVMDALRYECKLSIPGDVSIVGFDDIPNSKWPVYGLTTFKLPIARMVKRTIDNLIENQEQGPTQVTEMLNAQLILRDSVRA